MAQISVILLLSGVYGFHWFDPLARWIGLGNRAYESGDFEKAQKAYEEAAKTAPGSAEVSNNLGVVAYKSNELEKAGQEFEEAQLSKDRSIQSDAFYNEGVVLMKSGQYESAADAFQKALIADPSDMDAKVNLELVRRMMQQVTPTPQSQNQQQDQEQQGTPPTPQSTPSGEPSPSSEEQLQTTPTPPPETTPETPREQESESREEQTPTPQSDSQAQPQGIVTPTPSVDESTPVEEGKMRREDAARLLDAMEDEELEILKKFHQLPEVDERQIEKDW